MNVVRRFLLALLLALSAAVAVPSSAPAARGMEIALQDDQVFVNQWWFNRETALQRARALGVSRIRANLGWAKVLGRPKARKRPEDMAYNWAAYDSLIADAARYGIALELTLVGPGGEVRFEHRSANAGDSAEPDVLLAALSSAG